MEIINDTNRIVAICKLLSHESNLKILKELQNKESYILELEKSVGLDRSNIKHRLYALQKVGLLDSVARKTPKGGRAIYYKIRSIKISSVSLAKIVKGMDISKIKKLSKVY
jgi:predicted transcriptional regulator